MVEGKARQGREMVEGKARQGREGFCVRGKHISGNVIEELSVQDR